MQTGSTDRFSGLAHAWDGAAGSLGLDAMRPIRYGKCYRYLAGVSRQSRVLEVGCGEGTGLCFAQRLGFENLTGVEVSEERLNSARGKVGKQATLRLVAPDCRLPLADNSCDVVVSAAVIEHTVNPTLFVQEIGRVIRPGGSVVISSDCLQWRILQILGAYQSLQPIDRAMPTRRLMTMLRLAGLPVIHFDGFARPGYDYTFCRMMWAHLTWPARTAIRRIRPSPAHLAVSGPSPSGSNSEGEVFLRVAMEGWDQSKVRRRLLRSLLSDENVFYAVSMKDE